MTNNSSEFLSIDQIVAAIEQPNLRYLAQIDILQTIDSTNTYLLQKIKSGAPSGTVCFAEQQTAGRGRRGREWFSPPAANIYCSLVWRFKHIEQAAGLSLAVGVMVAEALKKYAITHAIHLKWPNDIMCNHRKLGGILLEASGEAVVIGIGLNLFLPPEADADWIALSEVASQPIQRNYFAGILLNELLSQIPVIQAKGFRAFYDAWCALDFLREQNISVHTPLEVFSGKMMGVNDKGELMLQQEDGVVKTFAYGEVSVRLARRV